MNSPNSAPPLQKILEERGIVAPHLLQADRVHADFKLEHPCALTKTATWTLPLSIGAFSMVHGPGHVQSASIGRYCSIAPYVVIGANEHAIEWLSTSSLLENPQLFNWNRLESLSALNTVKGIVFGESIKPIKIGNDVWIGQGAFIKGGVTIGDGAIIGSMANVIHDIPPYAIAVGNPARVLRYRFPDTIIKACLDFKWWRFAPDALINAGPTDVERALEALAKAEQVEAIKAYTGHALTSAFLRENGYFVT